MNKRRDNPFSPSISSRLPKANGEIYGVRSDKHPTYSQQADKSHTRQNPLIPFLLFFGRILANLEQLSRTDERREHKTTFLLPSNTELPAIRRKAEELKTNLQRAGKAELAFICRELATEIIRIIDATTPGRFTRSFVKFLHDDLALILHHVSALAGPEDADLLYILEKTKAARSELQIAYELFDIQEILPIYRLIIRTKAILTLRGILAGLSGDPTTDAPRIKKDKKKKKEIEEKERKKRKGEESKKKKFTRK